MILLIQPVLEAQVTYNRYQDNAPEVTYGKLRLSASGGWGHLTAYPGSNNPEPLTSYSKKLRHGITGALSATWFLDRNLGLGFSYGHFRSHQQDADLHFQYNGKLYLISKIEDKTFVDNIYADFQYRTFPWEWLHLIINAQIGYVRYMNLYQFGERYVAKGDAIGSKLALILEHPLNDRLFIHTTFSILQCDLYKYHVTNGYISTDIKLDSDPLPLSRTEIMAGISVLLY